MKNNSSSFPSDDWSTYQRKRLILSNDTEPIIVRPGEATICTWTFLKVLHLCLATPIVMIRHATFADNAHFTAKQLLDGISLAADSSAPLDPFSPPKEGAGPFLKEVRSVSAEVNEMVFVKIVDNFTTYLSELLRDVLRIKPELLKSSETISYEFALSFHTIEELRETIVDRKVNDLTYLGFPKLLSWMSSKLGLAELQNCPSASTVSHAIELRNCIVHNRGKASPKLIQSFGSQITQAIGSQIEISIDDLYLAGVSTWAIVEKMDVLVGEKFGLKFEQNTETSN